MGERIVLSPDIARRRDAPRTHGDLWVDGHGRVVGQYFGCSMSSVFEPILDLASGDHFGDEALIRSAGSDGEGLSPWRLFYHAADDAQLVALDRLCRSIHAASYFGGGGKGPLFLKVHGRLLLAIRDDHGKVFRGVLDHLHVVPSQVVIETPESLANAPEVLAHVLRNYRRNGYRIALKVGNDRQAAQVFEHVAPDFLVIDAGQVPDAPALARLVALAHGRGVATVVRRIDSESHAANVRSAGVRLGQGYGLGKPKRNKVSAAGS